MLDRREDPDGYGAWLGHPDQADNPFILVLVSFFKDQEKGPQPIMAPFAHIGIEVPIARRRRTHRRDGRRPKAASCGRPPTCPIPIGYICAVTDPDGNVVEISHNQGVYDKAMEVWGKKRPR